MDRLELKVKDVEGQNEQNKMFQGGYTKVKGNGKTDLKRGLLIEEVHTLSSTAVISPQGKVEERERGESHMAPLHSQRYSEKD